MAAELPLSVWATAQCPAAQQRAGRYLPASREHPAKMLPAVAAHAVAGYSGPGELVVDPMCGIGTVVVEAAYLGRRAIGIECEPEWADLARANLAHARAAGAAGHGQVVTGDARALVDLLDADVFGEAAVVVTSPPYGPSTHGQVRASRGNGVTKWSYDYGRTPANLARTSVERLLAGFTQILAGCAVLLRPDGVAVITTRPWRHGEELVDFPSLVQAAAQDAGLVPYERLVALLAGLRGDTLVPRASFFQLLRVRDARARGVPLRVIAHEDVLVFRKPETAASSAALFARDGAGDGSA